METACEICGGRDGEAVEVFLQHDGVPESRVLCGPHQMAEVDLGAVRIEPSTTNLRREQP